MRIRNTEPGGVVIPGRAVVEDGAAVVSGSGLAAEAMAKLEVR